MKDAAVYALRLGDDALVLAQRLSEWSARAPELEEDLALTNIALDLLGQARALLTRAGELEGAGRDEDDLAYLRGDREFLNALIVEQPNGDFARTIARQLLFSTYQLALYDRLRDSADPVISGVAEQGGQGGRLPPRPRARVDAAPRRRHRGEPSPHAGGRRLDVAARGRAVRARRAHRAPRAPRGSPSTRASCARRGSTSSAACSRRRRSIAPRRPTRPPAGVAARTPRRSATCSL